MRIVLVGHGRMGRLIEQTALAAGDEIAAVADIDNIGDLEKLGKVADVVIDCWEHEPDVDRTLLDRAALATPHIAGYSADGKANAAMQSVRAVSRFFGLGLDDWTPGGLPAPYNIDREELADVRDFFLRTYDIEADSRRLKEHPEQFEQLRSNYPFRREPVAYLDGQGATAEVERIWKGL